MSDNNKTDQYIEHINSHILPFIDYDKLQASYGTDMVYAKGILNLLHEAMTEVYGSEQLDEMDGDEGFVVVPGVVRGKDTGNMALALLDLDLSSSGEHWGTAFLCKYGIVSQNEDRTSPAGKEMAAAIGSYDYCYTAAIPGDIHVDRASLPDGIKGVLDDFKNHRAALQYAGEQLQGDSSMEYYGIWAVRGPGSVMGRAEAWSKRDGVPEVFTTKAEAEAQTGQYNKNIVSANVHYYVKEMEPELAHSALRDMEKAAAHIAGNDISAKKPNPLAAAEMSAEQNYNMLDERINNLPPTRANLTDGQTYAEIKELAAETLPDERPSVTEKLEAAKAEAAKQATPKKSGPHKSKEAEL